MLEAEADALKDVLSILGLKLEESVEDEEEEIDSNDQTKTDEDDSEESKQGFYHRET